MRMRRVAFTCDRSFGSTKVLNDDPDVIDAPAGFPLVAIARVGMCGLK